MNSAQRVIAKFGSQIALATALERPQSTIQYWARTGNIPIKWHAPIIGVAQKIGVDLDPRDLTAPIITRQVVSQNLPTAKWPGILDVNGIEIPCFVLDDERRVITRTGALSYITDGKGGGNLESYLRIEALRQFLPNDIDEQFIEFSLVEVTANTVKGLSASAFIDICRAFSRARDTGAITSESQVQNAIRASMLLAAFAKNGIESAIDEATGYQYERADDYIRTKLKLFLEEEMRPWEKTFPDELWIQFGRLTKWRGPVNSRPKYWGKLVMELVYSYLDNDVFEWLKENAPIPRSGQNYHQWLSSQFGLKKLVEHIWMLIGMASACRDMPELRQKMAEKFGRTGVQLTFYFPPHRG